MGSGRLFARWRWRRTRWWRWRRRTWWRWGGRRTWRRWIFRRSASVIGRVVQSKSLHEPVCASTSEPPRSASRRKSPRAVWSQSAPLGRSGSKSSGQSPCASAGHASGYGRGGQRRTAGLAVATVQPAAQPEPGQQFPQHAGWFCRSAGCRLGASAPCTIAVAWWKWRQDGHRTWRRPTDRRRRRWQPNGARRNDRRRRPHRRVVHGARRQYLH
jgi:hypothetical protein